MGATQVVAEFEPMRALSLSLHLMTNDRSWKRSNTSELRKWTDGSGWTSRGTEWRCA